MQLFTTSVLIAALLSVTGSVHFRGVGLALAFPALIGTWWPAPGPDATVHLVGLGFSSLFFGFVAAAIFVHVFRQDNVTADTLFGAVCVYVLLGLFWAFLYLLMERIAPGSFGLVGTLEMSRSDLLSKFIYFSFATLTTTGYGDITPVTEQAQSIAILQQGVGVLYVAMMVARLVGMYRPTGSSAE